MDSFHEMMEEYSFPYYEPENIELKNKIGEGGTSKVYNGTLTIFGDTIDCIVKQVSSDNYDEYHRNRMMYQDIISNIKSKFSIPVFAYQVSGEYAMIRAAADAGYLNHKDAVMESVLSIKRSGASGILTYSAIDIAQWLSE